MTRRIRQAAHPSLSLQPLFLLLLLLPSPSSAFLLPSSLHSPPRSSHIPLYSSSSIPTTSTTSNNNNNFLYQGFWHEALKIIQARDPSTFPWQPLELPPTLQHQECITSGKGKRPDTTTVAEIFAYTIPGRIRQARAAILTTTPGGVPPKVLNLVIFPDPLLDLPIFGADFVALPGGHLIVLDFQPVSSSCLSNQGVDEKLKGLYEKYSPDLPLVGEIPEAAKAFFSPYFLFVRTEEDGVVETKVFEAFKEYLGVYLDLVAGAEVVPVEEEGKRREISEGHGRYSTYRAVNDPARGMLTRMYGEEWTERVIYEVLFDMAEKKEKKG